MVRYYQRLVVNPFLAVVGVLATIGLRGWFEGGYRPDRIHPMLLTGILLSLCLLQYHCLDCGATGMYPNWKKHVCPGVRDRWISGFPFWNRLFPSPTTQLTIWMIGFLVIGIWIMTGLHR